MHQQQIVINRTSSVYRSLICKKLYLDEPLVQLGSKSLFESGVVKGTPYNHLFSPFFHGSYSIIVSRSFMGTSIYIYTLRRLMHGSASIYEFLV